MILKLVVYTAILFTSLPSFAGVTDTFNSLVDKDKKLYAAIDAQMKKGGRAGCKSPASQPLSTCFNEHLKKHPIKSTTALGYMVSGTVQASLYDNAHGHKGIPAQLLFFDNVATVFERIDPSQFYVAKLEAKTAADKESVKNLKKTEMDILNMIARQTLSLVLPRLKELDAKLTAPGRKVSSSDSRYVTEYQSVKERLTKLEKKTYKLP